MASRKGAVAAAALGGAAGVLVGQGLLAGLGLLIVWRLDRARQAELFVSSAAFGAVLGWLMYEEET